MKIGILQVIGWIFIIRDEINAAYKDDKKISAREMLVMYKNINAKIKLPVDEKTQKVINLVTELVGEMDAIVVDNKITLSEIVYIAELACTQLGYDLDNQGIVLPDKLKD